MGDEDLATRFWEKVDRRGPGECWEWTGSRDGTGHGLFQDRGDGPELAHRIAYRLLHGHIPEGRSVCHRCGSRACVNPQHLFLGPKGYNAREWFNINKEQPDDEMIRILRMRRRCAHLPRETKDIRGLITRLEICHFKFGRHIQKIVEAIGRTRLDFDPNSIGRFHPKPDEDAWKGDRTGRSRQGQEYIWILQMWLSGDAQLPEDDSRGIPQSLFASVYDAFGSRDPKKEALVSALVDRLMWKADQQPPPEGFETLSAQIGCTDICHYSFPKNVQRVIEAIGRLEPLPDFGGCGSSDEVQRQCAQRYFDALGAWLGGKSIEDAAPLGERTPPKAWLVACLAKTVKELAGLESSLPLVPVSGIEAGSG